ncbi:hypothetical protein Tco_1573724 [Tanacetum coccineum]
MARKSMSQTKQQECKVAENANNKRKWEGNHNGKGTEKGENYKKQNTGKAYAAGHREKKYYDGSKPLCPKCNYHHDGPCAPKCHRCNIVGHLVHNWALQEGLPRTKEPKS